MQPHQAERTSFSRENVSLLSNKTHHVHPECVRHEPAFEKELLYWHLGQKEEYLLSLRKNTNTHCLKEQIDQNLRFPLGFSFWPTCHIWMFHEAHWSRRSKENPQQQRLAFAGKGLFPTGFFPRPRRGPCQKICLTSTESDYFSKNTLELLTFP